MNNVTTQPKPKAAGNKRDLLPYRFKLIAEFLCAEAGTNDAALERAIAITTLGMEDGTIQVVAGKDLLLTLFAAFRDNDHMHDVLTLLRTAGMEDAQREVERIELLRRSAKEGKKNV